MNTATLKILTVYYKHKPGGFCKRLKMKIDACLERGWRVHYVAVQAYPYTHANLVPHILWTPFSKHDSPLFWIWFFITAPFYILWVAWQQRPDLISVFSPLYACLCGPAKRLLAIPMLTFIRSLPYRSTDFAYRGSAFAARFERLMDRLGIGLSDRLLANSATVRDAMLKRHRRAAAKTGILTNHIQPADFDRDIKKRILAEAFSLNRDAFVVATSGILQPQKNQDVLIKAFAAAGLPQAVLLLIGDGEAKEELEALARELGVAERTIFTGWRDDVADLLQGSDLFVFASAQEGMSNSLLEALAADLPCFVSDTPENRDVLQNPVQFFPADAPETLAQKIRRAAEDGEYYRQLKASTAIDKERLVFDWAAAVTGEIEGLVTENSKKSGIG